MKTTLPLSVVIALAVSMLAPGAAAQRTYNFDVPAGKLERRADPIGRDVLPKRTKRAGPAYPAGLGTMNGVVHLQVTTEPSGQVAETRPLHFLTIGDQPKDDMKTLAERFAASAVAAVSRWEYEPTRKAMTFLMSLIIRPSSADGAASQATIDINLPETQVLKRLRHVRPVYPPMALSNGIQGVVIVEATVAPDGKVLDARVVRPIPFLDRAALEAVVQWEFEPFEVTAGRVVVTQLWLNFALR